MAPREPAGVAAPRLPPPDADARVRELERRIEELEAEREEAFGRFGTLDWIACIGFALLLPAAVLIWFGR